MSCSTGHALFGQRCRAGRCGGLRRGRGNLRGVDEPESPDLGMEHTRFSNPDGLEDEGNYSTARDMARLAQVCLANEKLQEIVSTKTITVGERSLVNHNKLLWRYEGCIGLKTGYTDLAADAGVCGGAERTDPHCGDPL